MLERPVHGRLLPFPRMSTGLGLRLLPAMGTLAIVAMAYVLAAQLGFALAFGTKQVSAIWPPTGIALAALLLRGWGAWPGIFLGAFASNALSQEALYTAAGIALGNTAGPLAGAYLLRRFVGIDADLSRLRDVLGLAFLGAALAMTITASNGVAHLALGGLVPWSAYPAVWWVWWVGDAMGVLLVAPVILTWFSGPRLRWQGARLLELALLAGVLVLASVFFFSTSLPLAYPIFPVVFWVALRFEQRETATAVLLVSGIAVWQTIHDRGPFVRGSFDDRLVVLVTFMAVLAVTALALGALSTERRRAEASLRTANDDLEARVEARTAQLATVNGELLSTNAQLQQRTAELARKNEEVEAFVYLVSHDLRAPLVNLQGFSRELEFSCEDLAKTLRGLPMPEAAAESVRATMSEGIGGALRYIGTSVSKFERLINALLTLSRTGLQQYQFEEVDVRGVVQSTLASMRQTVEASGASIAVTEMPKAVADATAVGQILSNLINNSLKYLQPGRPGEIVVGGEAEGSMSHYWVTDNGAGIPSGARDRLFQVFQRFHPELAAGEGIGLAAIKRIVERHGGKIWAQSEAGSGSTFHFTLPREQRT